MFNGYAADEFLVATRADVLAQLGRREAAPAYERALGLSSDEAVRRFLTVRLAACSRR